jgi:hypothetical protein
MLQELAAQTGASGWVVGSLLFFVAAWAVIAWRVFRASPEALDTRARLPLEGDGEARQGAASDTQTRR